MQFLQSRNQIQENLFLHLTKDTNTLFNALLIHTLYTLTYTEHSEYININ